MQVVKINPITSSYCVPAFRLFATLENRVKPFCLLLFSLRGFILVDRCGILPMTGRTKLPLRRETSRN